MKTDIEKILRDHRHQLDVETPPSDAWESIRAEIESKPAKNSSTSTWWKAAAAVFLLTSVGLLAYNLSLQEQVEELASLGDISEEYREMESSYQSQINKLTSQIPMKEVLEADELAWMADELKVLEEVNTQYRQDIGKNADQDLLVEALIDYYEKKIRLLKKLELEINRQKNEERNTDHISAI